MKKLIFSALLLSILFAYLWMTIAEQKQFVTPRAYTSGNNQPEVKWEVTISPESHLDKNTPLEAWDIYLNAVTILQDEGNRAKAAEMFNEVVEKYPLSQYASNSKELSELLKKMVEEDKNWKEPEDISELSVEEKINYYIYKLRDVQCYQFNQPGQCSVLFGQWNSPEKWNAAMRLKDIGEPAVPALINLLNDRRPIRSVGFWRSYHPSRTVLRYQDAAMEILNKILSGSEHLTIWNWDYPSTQGYKSVQSIIEDMKSWWQKTQGKSYIEKQWIYLERLERRNICINFGGRISLIRNIAKDESQKEKVLAKLREMYDNPDGFYQPEIVEVMIEFGDDSKLVDISNAVYNGTKVSAEALRVMILYGKDAEWNFIVDKLSKYDESFLELVCGALSGGLPGNHSSKQYILPALISCLFEMKSIYSNYSNDGKSWSRIRQCDIIASIVSNLTGKDFGYDRNLEQSQRDAVIEKIKKWWEENNAETR